MKKDIDALHGDIMDSLKFAAQLAQQRRLPDSFRPSNVHDIKAQLVKAMATCDKLLAH